MNCEQLYLVRHVHFIRTYYVLLKKLKNEFRDFLSYFIWLYCYFLTFLMQHWGYPILKSLCNHFVLKYLLCWACLFPHRFKSSKEPWMLSPANISVRKSSFFFHAEFHPQVIFNRNWKLLHKGFLKLKKEG